MILCHLPKNPRDSGISNDVKAPAPGNTVIYAHQEY